MNIIACQLNTVWEDKPANHARVQALLAGVNVAPGSLIVLPEMFATGFSMNVAEIVEDARQETQTFMAQLATEAQCYVLGGIVSAGTAGKGRNEAVVYGPNGGEIGRYCKMHPFSFSGETNFYEPGEHPLVVGLGEFAVSPFVCYDLRFPEAFRSAVRQGAQLFCVIANWPAPRESHWLALLKARAIENQAYVVGVNRCGNDPTLFYSGRSQIIGPKGDVLADAGTDEGVIQAEIDLPSLLTYRRDFPALADIHPDYVRECPGIEMPGKQNLCENSFPTHAPS